MLKDNGHEHHFLPLPNIELLNSETCQTTNIQKLQFFHAKNIKDLNNMCLPFFPES